MAVAGSVCYGGVGATEKTAGDSALGIRTVAGRGCICSVGAAEDAARDSRKIQFQIWREIQI